MKKHYLEENGSRWYVKIGNKSDESTCLYDNTALSWGEADVQNSKFPYYVIFDKDTGIEAVYPSLKRLKEDESD